MDKQFGDRLKELRLEKNLTQLELAELFNTGKSTISHYESNRRLPDANIITTFADYFKVSLDYIMGRTDLRDDKESFIDSSPKKDNMFFADRLRYLLVTSGITADAISQKLNIDKDEFLSYAKGISFPSAQTLKNIATILNTSLDYLLGVTDNPETKATCQTDKEEDLILPDYIEIAKIAQAKKIPAKALSDFIKLFLENK